MILKLFNGRYCINKPIQGWGEEVPCIFYISKILYQKGELKLALEDENALKSAKQLTGWKTGHVSENETGNLELPVSFALRYGFREFIKITQNRNSVPYFSHFRSWSNEMRLCLRSSFSKRAKLNIAGIVYLNFCHGQYEIVFKNESLKDDAQRITGWADGFRLGFSLLIPVDDQNQILTRQCIRTACLKYDQFELS